MALSFALESTPFVCATIIFGVQAIGTYVEEKSGGQEDIMPFGGGVFKPNRSLGDPDTLRDGYEVIKIMSYTTAGLLFFWWLGSKLV